MSELPSERPLNQVQVHRPPCPQCGGPTSLARIEPLAQTDHDQRTFDCLTCSHANTITVKYR
jgi:hypothetical protein